MDLKAKILDYAAKNGVDLIGFAPKARFEGVTPQLNPFTIFPEGKTVIVLGKRIMRGSLRGVEEATNFGDFSLFGAAWLEDEFLAIACYDLTRVIEDEGWEACPIFNNPPEAGGQGISVRTGAMAPNVTPDFGYAAVACGLGEISYNGLFFSKAFGSRQRLQMVITDAEIEPSPILQESVCDRCGACAKACPVGAIKAEGASDVVVCGKSMKVADIDYKLCRLCKNGALPSRLHRNAKPDRIPALCNRTCLVHLEEGKRVTSQFENAFRKRPAWALDVAGNDVSKK